MDYNVATPCRHIYHSVRRLIKVCTDCMRVFTSPTNCKQSSKSNSAAFVSDIVRPQVGDAAIPVCIMFQHLYTLQNATDLCCHLTDFTKRAAHSQGITWLHPTCFRLALTAQVRPAIRVCCIELTPTWSVFPQLRLFMAPRYVA